MSLPINYKNFKIITFHVHEKWVLKLSMWFDKKDRFQNMVNVSSIVTTEKHFKERIVVQQTKIVLSLLLLLLLWL